MPNEVHIPDPAAKLAPIHHRKRANLPAACGEPPFNQWADDWRYVNCSACLAVAPAPPP